MASTHGKSKVYIVLYMISDIILSSPGRFFAANNIKIILAHLLLNYDVQPFQSRPPNISLGDISVVPVKATMMVRRREIKA